MAYHVGEILTNPNSKESLTYKKRCVRILFGEIYSFDHPEYYSTCARAKTFTEHMALKDYALEHTKPIFNKYNLTCIIFMS